MADGLCNMHKQITTSARRVPHGPGDAGVYLCPIYHLQVVEVDRAARQVLFKLLEESSQGEVIGGHPGYSSARCILDNNLVSVAALVCPALIHPLANVFMALYDCRLVLINFFWQVLEGEQGGLSKFARVWK